MHVRFDDHDAFMCVSDAHFCIHCRLLEVDWTFTHCRTCGREMLDQERYKALLKKRIIVVLADTGLMSLNCMGGTNVRLED